MRNIKRELNDNIELLDNSRLNILKERNKDKRSKYKSSRIKDVIYLEQKKILKKVNDINHILNIANEEEKKNVKKK